MKLLNFRALGLRLLAHKLNRAVFNVLSDTFAMFSQIDFCE